MYQKTGRFSAYLLKFKSNLTKLGKLYWQKEGENKAECFTCIPSLNSTAWYYSSIENFSKSTGGKAGKFTT